MIQFDEHIFQMGWFNHQLVLFSYYDGSETVHEVFITSIRAAGVCGEFPSSSRWVAGALAASGKLVPFWLKFGSNPQLRGCPWTC